MYTGVQMPPKTRRGCEPLDMGAGNKTQFLISFLCSRYMEGRGQHNGKAIVVGVVDTRKDNRSTMGKLS